jgi:NAD(P)-dependent dehydrogenase (short-subunit alcohol dehydrogenase family)
MDMFNLSGKVALVAGATKGMGLSVAKALGYAGAMPMKRIAEPEDVAGLAVLLALPAGRFIHGQNFSVDGGMTA